MALATSQNLFYCVWFVIRLSQIILWKYPILSTASVTHKEYHDRQVELFQNKHSDIRGFKKTVHNVIEGENVKVMEVSYSVFYLVAKSRATADR